LDRGELELGETAQSYGAIALWTGLSFAALALGLRLTSFKVPVFDGDEYAFALVARDVLHGHLPNTGVFDNKPVGLTYLFALAEALGGQTVFALRALGLAGSTACAALLFVSSRRLGLGRGGALMIAALFMLGALCLGGFTTLSELLACPLLAAANALLVSERRSPIALLAIGAALGLACQVTYLAAPCAILTVAGGVVIGRRQAFTQRLRDAALMAVGGAVAALAVWTPQLIAGGWGAYLADQLRYHQGYRLAAFRWGDWMAGFGLPVAALGFPIAALGLLRLQPDPGAAPGGRAKTPPLFWIIGLQGLGAVLAATASNRFYPHYLLLALPADAVMTALLLAAPAGPHRRAGWRVLTAILLLSAALSFALLLSRLKAPRVELQAATVADRLTRPGQSLFVFDEAPAIYYLAKRPAAGRYIFPSHYLSTCDHAPAIVAPATVLAGALAQQPALVLVGALCPPESDAAPAILKAGYRRVEVLQTGPRRIIFYAPRDPGAAPARLSPPGAAATP
jgi:hypothetical protein